MINKTITNFRTTLAQSMTATQSTIALSSITTFDGHELSASDLGDTVFLVVEPGAANMEIIKVDATSLEGNTFKNILYRGMPFYGDEEKSVPSNRKGHQAGSVVIISNVHYYYNPLFSFIEQYDGHWEGAAATYSELPPGKNDGEVRVTLDDSKVYVWSEPEQAWKLAGAGGGAGTVYRTDKIGSDSEDKRTFVMNTGSFPNDKYLQVYRNGVLMENGEGADYTTTNNNTVIFEYDVEDEDKITLLVVSVDLVASLWTSVDDNILPDVDNTHNIGSSTSRFKDGYLGGNLSVGGGLTVGGTTTFSAIPTIPTTTPTTAGQVIALDTNAKLPAVDGSNLTNITTLSFQSIPYYSGTETSHHVLRITSNSDGSVLFIAHLQSTEVTLNRLAKDGSGQYVITHTQSAALGDNPIKFSLAVVGNYLYLSTYGISSDSKVFRYLAADLSGKQDITISGTKYGSAGGDASFGDGTNLYVYKSENVFSKYTISGTTITFDSDITYTSAGRVDNGGAISDGVSVWMAATTNTSIVIKKYAFTGGAASATKSTFYIVKGYASQSTARLFLGKSGMIGIAYGYSPFDGSTVTGAVMNLNYVTAP